MSSVWCRMYPALQMAQMGWWQLACLCIILTSRSCFSLGWERWLPTL